MIIRKEHFENFNNAYEVSAELTRSLETVLLSSDCDKQILAILAACYTVTDCLASCIATMGFDDSEITEVVERTPAHYRRAATTMEELADALMETLRSNPNNAVEDYRYVQWASALITLSEYLLYFLH